GAEYGSAWAYLPNFLKKPSFSSSSSVPSSRYLSRLVSAFPAGAFCATISIVFQALMRDARRKGKTRRDVLVGLLHRLGIFLLHALHQDRRRFLLAREQLVRAFGVGLLEALDGVAVFLEELAAHDDRVHRVRRGLHVAHVRQHGHAEPRRFAELGIGEHRRVERARR